MNSLGYKQGASSMILRFIRRKMRVELPEGHVKRRLWRSVDEYEQIIVELLLVLPLVLHEAQKFVTSLVLAPASNPEYG
jgi:hypothetical protein